MTLRLRGSTSQYVDITASPNAGDATLTLPTTTGTIRTTSPSGVDGDYTVATGATISGSTNVITASTNGEERVRITSDGNVGIGTLIPAGKLQVGQSGGSNVIITEHIGVDINDGTINLYQATSNVNAVPFLISTDVGGTETEKLRVSGGGNLGIGTDNPDDKLHVLGNIVGRVTPKTFTITQGSSSFGQVDTFSINADITRIYLNHSFTSTDSSTRTYTANITSGLPTALGSRIEVEVLSARTNNSSSSIVGHQTVLQFNGTTILDSVYTTITYLSPANAYSKKLIGTAILTSEGWKLEGVVYGRDLTITDGNIKFDEGHGINFHNYGSGTDIDSNLLDDYEEGTWTPSLGSIGQSGSWTETLRVGYYSKIGRVVHLQYAIDWSAIPSVGGHVYIQGLPFEYTSATNGNAFGCAVAYHTGLNASNVKLLGRTTGGLTRTALGLIINGSTEIVATTPALYAIDSSGGSMRGSVTYIT